MSSWIADDRNALAVGRVLDAAGRLFIERGVSATGMADIAREAGCSRATLYRYFDSRDALRSAYIAREAVAVARAVGRAVASIDDPAERLTEAVLGTVAHVRSTPTLAAWFTADDPGPANRLGSSSEVVEALAAGIADGAAARWLVRSIVSLLTNPGADAAEERDLVERFLVPPVLAASARYGATHD